MSIRTSFHAAFFLLLVICPLRGADPIQLGTRLELFVDDFLIEEMNGDVSQHLHRPEPQEVVIVADIVVGVGFRDKHLLTVSRFLREQFVPGNVSSVNDSVDHCLGEQIVAFCTGGGCRPLVTCRTAQLLPVQKLVALGRGVSLIPSMAAQTDQSGTIKYRSLTRNRPTRSLALVWRKHRYQSRLVKEFADSLRTTTAKKS